ncbi:hypothetical protein PHYBLDRAFT_164535 [Phycomyces blakesleeanus NRRL 1555(-)]|uniref:Uncharacterized protein n=1 Tax=Phycomyces blakesleeanus (strain ATCC 8743b / DSM 1359 / FGSC 10004 / NBRC 33097 / NRRL 1555) TaxID=763407 RepID=A0A167PC12_PHYB8|nr:hypothetical protein PHYBLDRAFT_164535 [Phycomyces blakesleeanus NRRL 1555(-)]OAD77634.1 hypothetical protein PHYBLDRAFT_164535 [Phycomyces blakesleeanus NRRL 1555(-)]|eukprot:XP_018295674.1 hypothetical protein PHYBLDRAFT_164535 [Phycomyces blakesleeanus NRRL 1555(-)]
MPKFKSSLIETIKIFAMTCSCTRRDHFTSLEGESSLGPDTKFYKTIDGIRLDCLLIEVKCPNSTSDDDLFKLSIEMQYTLNRLVEHGVDNPDVYGVLVYSLKETNQRKNDE